MGQQIITDSNKSPLVELFVWIFLSTSVMTVIVRIVTKIVYVRKLSQDDFFILASMVLAIAQSIVVWLSTRNGFGQRLNTLNTAQIKALSKSQYAANLLDIAVLCLIKLSILSFINSLTTVRRHRQLVIVLGISILLWTLSSELSMAFLCGLPYPWNYIRSSCFNRRVIFWRYFAAVNITTEVAQILLILGIITALKTPLKRKITLYVVFGVRVLVIVMTIMQIIFLNQASASRDPTFDLWPFVTTTQAIQCISFVTACIPYLKPFLRSLESGLFRADDLHGFGATTMDSNSRTALSSKSKTLSSTNPESSVAALELDRFRSARLQYTTSTATQDGHRGWDGQSQTSQSKMITKTRSWAVKVERNHSQE